MAEEPIRKEDIIDEKGILASIQIIIDGLKTLMEAQMKTIIAMREVVKGMNPSTPEGQSGIKQVSADIDDAAPRIKALNDLLKELTRRQEELAVSTGKSNKEFRDDTKALVTAQKALQGTFQETKSVEGSINKLKEELKKLTKEYNNMDAAARGKTAPAIKKLTDELKKAESAIGNNTRKVGDYTGALSGMSIKVIDAIKGFFSFAAISTVLMGAVHKLKEAFISTVAGMDTMNIIAAVSKQVFYDLVTSFELNWKNIKNTIEATTALNKIRAGDRDDMIEFAKREREIARLEFEAADKTKSHAEQAEALNKAIERQNKLSDRRIADAWEELVAIEDLLSKQPQTEDLLNKQADLKVKIIDLDEQRFSSMKRNETRATAFEQEEKTRIQKQYDDLMKATDEQIKIDEDKEKKTREIRIAAALESVQDAENVRDQIAATDKAYFDKKDKAAEDNWAFNLALGKENFAAQKQQAKDAWDKMTDDEKKAAEDSAEIQQRKAQLYQDINAGMFGLLGAMLESNKQKELDAAGDNAEQKEKIEREYAKKAKVMAISQAIISTALAVLNALNTKPYLPLGPLMAISAAALGAIQIATIAATKFAEGGDILGKPHSQGGTMIEAERGEYVVKKQSTSKYHDLIEAINEDNPMRIAEEIRNRNFHTIWGGVSTQLSSISKQDPYTRMMYELMKNDIKIYTDSNGDTNIVSPNGSRKIIRKYDA